MVSDVAEHGVTNAPTANHGGEASSMSHKLRKRRRQLGLTQSELADLAEVSLRFVNNLEAGKTSVHLDKVLAVAEALGLELEVNVRSIP